MTVTGGSKGAFAGSGKSYTLLVTPTGSQDVVVTVAADAATDGANLGPPQAVAATARWDTTAPAAPTFSPENGAAVSNAATNITITFNEALRKDADGTALANADLASILTLKVNDNTGNAIGFAASIDDAKKVITLNPNADLAEGTVYVAISAEHWDAAGNKGSLRTATFTVDTTAPAAPTFSPAHEATVSDASTDITISFAEALRKDANGTALANNDLAAILTLKVGDDTGAAIGFSATIDADKKVITLDPANDLAPGKVYVAISDQHWDAAGNQGAQHTATFTVDTAAPTLAITGVPEAINATDAFTATFTFSEDVTGFATGDVTVTGGSKGAFAGSGKSYTLLVTPTGSQDVVVTVAADAATDGANLGPPQAVAATARWDTTAPAAPTFSPENGAAVSNAATNITITFNEALRKDADGTALANADLASILTLKVNDNTGNAIGFAASIDDAKKVITLNPNADLAEGTVYVAISAEHWDAAGNKGSLRTATFTVDTTAPAAPTFSPAHEATVSDASTDITITFAEALRKDANGTALANNDLAAILTLKVDDDTGAAIGFSATIDADKKVITLDPANDLAPGKVYVAISAQHWDAAGNQGAQHTATFTVDTAAPTLAITGVPEAINATDAFTATFTFSEDVTGFVTGDVTVTGGSKGAFAGSGKSYTLLVTPTGSQDVVVTVAADAATDGANLGPAQAVAATARWDTTAPAAPTFSPENGDAVSNAATNITITFDEALRKDADGTALANADLASILTLKVNDNDGNAIGFAASIDDAKKVITLNPTSDLAEGTVYVAISAEHWDAAGNKGSLRTATFTVDTTAPAAPEFSPANAATVSDASTDITITFAEALRKDASGTALANADLAAILTLKVDDDTGAAIGFSATIDADKKVITLDPANDLAPGKVYVAISAHHFDAAGNQGAQRTATFTVDTAAPTLAITGVPEAINATDAFTATFTFSEDVTGFVTGDVTVTGGSKGAFAGSGKSYTLLVTPTGSQDVVVTVAAGRGHRRRQPGPGPGGRGDGALGHHRTGRAHLQPGERRRGLQRRHQHHHHLRRGAPQGRRRHGARQRRPRQHPDAEGERQRRQRHRFRGLHRRRQEGHHPQPDEQPRRGHGLRRHQRRALGRRRQQGIPAHRNLHGGYHRTGGARVQPGQRRHRLRRLDRHHHHLRRGAPQGRQRHGARQRRPRRHPDAEGGRRQRRRHRFLRHHRRGQEGHHPRPGERPRPRQGLRRHQRPPLRRRRQPGRPAHRHLHRRHGRADARDHRRAGGDQRDGRLHRDLHLLRGRDGLRHRRRDGDRRLEGGVRGQRQELHPAGDAHWQPGRGGHGGGRTRPPTAPTWARPRRSRRRRAGTPPPRPRPPSARRTAPRSPTPPPTSPSPSTRRSARTPTARRSPTPTSPAS